MNAITRGVKNATRSPLRSGAIIVMLAISIGLILSMLVARSSVLAKVEEVKATAGTTITITPAGVMGFAGGGDPLNAEQLTAIRSTEHIISTSATLNDQLGTDDTNLTSSLELGSFGQRQMRFESNSTSTTSGQEGAPSATMAPPSPRTTITGTTDVDSVATNGGSLSIVNGSTIEAGGNEYVALVGTDLANKNSLTAGSTFTAYNQTITVSGIFETGNTFQDSGIIMPLAALQTLTEQEDAVSSVTATVDSSSNVENVVTSLEASLGDDADITSQAEQAASSVTSLESIASLATAGVVGATIAGALIVLLSMIMIVRERRREIGVIKAIGGTNRSVILQFVTEALTLTTVSAIIGVGLGILVSGPMTTSLVNGSSTSADISVDSSRQNGPPAFVTRGINQLNQNVTQVTSTLTPEVFAIAFGMTMVIAMIGSALPAWFISRIRPAEVLRTE